MTVTIVGMGLIGGSLALDMKASGFASRVLGVDLHEGHRQEAMELGLADAMVDIDEGLAEADLVVLAIPVAAIREVLPRLLDRITDRQVITDMGSTKASILRDIKQHPARGRYVSSHPMAGTEHSGPKAAVPGLFRDKVGILCNPEESDADARQLVEKMYGALGMRMLTMDAEAHDMHAAYVSHISHISSFALALAVLEKEKNEKAIFNLASGGFDSTVRLAKSSPEMWAQVYGENAVHILEVLDAYIRIVEEFREHIRAGNINRLRDMMREANAIRKVLDNSRKT